MGSDSKEINIIYLRVSTNEKRQDLEQQFDYMLEKYQLKEFALLMDEASAYQIDKIQKREDFIILLDCLFDTSKNIKDLFLTYRFPQDQISLYVWDLSRIMRNLELNMQFFLLSKHFNIKINSAKDDKIYNAAEFEDPTNKLLELMTFSIDSYGAEKYSHDTALNIKRGYDKAKHGSTKGMAWGQGMSPNTNWQDHWSQEISNNKGESFSRLTDQGRLRMTINEINEVKAYITKLLKRGYMRIDIIKMVAENKGIIINQPYLTKNFAGKI